MSAMTDSKTPLLPPTDWTDLELLGRMLSREDVAWREFHRRFDRLVYRCIHKVTSRFHGVLNQEDVQDIYAQFLLNITARDMHKLRAFQPERGNKLGSWIGLLATNTAWDHMRRVARRPQTSELTEVPEVAYLSCERETPIDVLQRKEHWALVNETLEQFSEKDREFVQLYYVRGMQPTQVAETMNISIKTVYSKKHKIRCRLERALRAHAA